MKNRRTRAQKIKSASFKINLADLPDKKVTRKLEKEKVEANYLRFDLTKVFVLTMLALALEIALWLRLGHS